MSDVITGPGAYGNPRNRRMDVKFVDGECAYGRDQDGDWCVWSTIDGGNLLSNGTSYDITGPWIPDPPEPPAGFVVQDRETYRGVKGVDKVLICGEWQTVDGFEDMTAVEVDAEYPAKPHWFASPIPKPFSISEHGPGVYETRDGREEPVTWRSPGGGVWGREGQHPDWHDDGRMTALRELPGDLVRYLRPLPKQEQPQEEWTPTNELRNRSIELVGLVAKDKRENGMYSVYANGNWFSVVLEQKWTCGEKSEWRPVGVEP